MRLTCQKAGLLVLGAWMLAMCYVLVADLTQQNSEVKRLLNVPHSPHQVSPPPGGTVQVCMTSDENTVIGAVATINSVYRNTRHPVKFHLVTNSQTEPILRYWIDNSALRDIDYEIKIFDELKLKDKIRIRGGRTELAKPMNYARFYYGHIFPDLHGIIIHMDDDIIVQGDVYELAHVPMSPDSIITVADECSSPSKRFTSYKPIYSNFINFGAGEIQKLHLQPKACPFNTGLYVADLDKWREQNITEQLEYWMELNTRENIYGNERGGGGSQPPMMIVLYKNHTHLKDPMWHIRHLGLNPTNRYSRHYIQHAKLLHWNGKFKPWGGVSQYSDIWDSYFVPDPQHKLLPVRKDRKKS